MFLNNNFYKNYFQYSHRRFRVTISNNMCIINIVAENISRKSQQYVRVSDCSK